VYPERGPDVALRRLLLENVFLLAGRRVPVDVTLPIPANEAAEVRSCSQLHIITCMHG
jgi:hypothetical protein